MQPSCLLLWAATLSSAELFVNYDEKLEGRPKVYTVVKEEIGRLDVPSKSSHKNNDSKIPLGIDLKPREALDVLLGKRQTCAQGYGYCPSVLEDAVSRIAFAALMDIAILKDPRAAQLAHVAKAKPAAASATACPREINAAKTSLTVLQAITVIYPRCRTALFAAPTQNTYYWTITWYYWYYYWTYSIDIEASVVTSTRSTTQTVFSVKTTDAGAASEYFSEKSRTLSLPTPAAATSLESLAGSTSFASTPSSKSPSSNPGPSSEPSITEMPSAPFDPIPSSDSPDDNESSSSSESRSSSTTSLLRSGGDDGGSPPKSGGSGSSGAKPLWAGSDWKSLWVLALGVGTGVLAAVL